MFKLCRKNVIISFILDDCLSRILSSHLQVCPQSLSILAISYLVFKTINELNKQIPPKELIINWLVLIIFLLAWNLIEESINQSIFLWIGTFAKILICLMFEWINTNIQIVSNQWQIYRIKQKITKKTFELCSNFNLKLTKILLDLVSDQEKRLMKDQYICIFQQLPIPTRKEYIDQSTQSQETPPLFAQICSTKKQKIVFKKTETQKSIQFKSPQIVNEMSFTQILTQIKNQKNQNISFKSLVNCKQKISYKNNRFSATQPIRELSKPTFDLKQSNILIEDVGSPQQKSEHQFLQYKRNNTFSHRSESFQWTQKMNMSISVQYSDLIDSDDDVCQQQNQNQAKVVTEKKQQFKKKTLNTQKQKSSNTINRKRAQSKLIGRAEIYLQTGNSQYKLQRKIIKLFENDEVSLFSPQNILIESFKLIRMKPLRGEFYELKGQIDGNQISKMFKFKGDSTVFTKYIEVTSC